MADKTLTVTTVGGADKTLTFNRDRFAGVRNMTRVEAGGGSTDISVDRTVSGYKTGDKAGQSRPLLSKVVGGAAAAYSLRDLNDGQGPNKVVRVRRSSDNKEKDITAKGLSRLTDWVNAATDLPLDNSTSLIAAGMEPTEQYTWFSGADDGSSNITFPNTPATGPVVTITCKALVDQQQGIPQFGTLFHSGSNDVSYTIAGHWNSGATAMVGGGTLYVDGVLTVTRADFYAALAGEQVHDIRVEGFRLTAGDLELMAYSWNIFHASGTVFDFKIELNGDGVVNHAYTGVGDDAWTDTIGNNHGVIGTGVTKRWGDGLAVAYSLRNLSDSYTGPVVDVARDYDAAIKAFTATEVSDGTMLAWVLPASYVGNGYVSKLYDQSGNGNHALENASGWGQLVVENGVQCLEGGKPTIKVNNTADYLVIDTPIGGGDFSTFAVYKTTGDTSLIYRDPTAGGQPYAGRLGSGIIGMATTSPLQGGSHPNTQFVAHFQSVDSSISLNTNSITLNEGATTEGNRLIGTIGLIVGTYSEIVIYTSNKTADRNTITSNMGDYYNIDLPAGIDTGNNEVDGFVSVWYDQSGNGNHATQITASSQPKIADTGVLVTSGGLPAIDNYAAGSGISLQSSLLSKESQVYSHFSVFNTASTELSGMLLGNRIPLHYAGAVSQGGGATSAGTTSISYHKNGILLVSPTRVTLHAAFHSNTINLCSINMETAAGAFVDAAWVIQSFGTGTGNFNAKTLVSEWIIYESDQSANRLAIEANINTQYGIYTPSAPTPLTVIRT